MKKRVVEALNKTIAAMSRSPRSPLSESPERDVLDVLHDAILSHNEMIDTYQADGPQINVKETPGGLQVQYRGRRWLVTVSPQ